MYRPPVLVTAPTEDVVTLAEAKLQLRLSGTDEDGLIEALIDAAVGQFDPAAKGWLDRALRPQTWKVMRRGFPAGCGEISLPYPPLITVDSFNYDDVDGVEQTLAENTGFRILGAGTDRARLAPPYDGSWPAARDDEETVRIAFTCGYATADPDPLPPQIKQAVHLAIRLLHSLGERSMFESARDIAGVERKEWVVSDASAKLIKDATDALLANLRVY